MTVSDLQFALHALGVSYAVYNAWQKPEKRSELKKMTKNGHDRHMAKPEQSRTRKGLP